MTIETIFVVFGIVLVATALLGGGFQAREINIPKVGHLGRIFCAILGSAFILLGLALNLQQKFPARSERVASAQEATGWIGFKVTNQLGERQISEQVTVVIDGQVRGAITVSAMHPQADLLVSVPKSGRYHYQLAATTVFANDRNEPVEIDGAGEGYINVSAGSVHELAGDLSQGVWRVSLIQR